MFNRLELIPVDPLLGIIGAFRADKNPNKIDLGVGVYKDDTGVTPILKAVKLAEEQWLKTEQSKSYLGPLGVVGCNQRMQDLALGSDNEATTSGRARTVHTPGGTAAIRVALGICASLEPDSSVWFSNPSWPNYKALAPAAGLTPREYPYFNATDMTLDLDAILESLSQAKRNDIVILQTGCHNPTGIDPTPEQWGTLIELARDRGFIPLLDNAYQGYDVGIEEDARIMRRFVAELPNVLITSSCSKNFGLYRERVGAITAALEDATAAEKFESHVNKTSRGMYSMPPSHGAAVVDIILGSDELIQIWSDEVAEMRERLQTLRQDVVRAIAACETPRDFSFIGRQKGLFSMLGITPQQVRQLRDEFSIYMAESSRVNIAGLSKPCLDYFANALATVLG